MIITTPEAARLRLAQYLSPAFPVGGFAWSQGLEWAMDQGAATRATLSNSRYVTVKKGTLYVTRLMEWYGGDFVNPEWEGAGENIAAFVKPYASEEVAALIEEKGGEPRVKFLEYDWNLNKK